jgi:tyrosine-specific transport protein
MTSKKKIFNATLLISGTTIGAGMLALPIVTASCGFMPSMLVFFVCYIFMMATGLVRVEALVWFKGDYNLISLSSKLLGRYGRWASWILYLFLFYTLTVAYTAGGAEILQIALKVPKPFSEVLFVGVFSFFVMKGTRYVIKINHYLLMGMIISYLALMVSGFQNLNFSFLKIQDYSKAFWGLPVVFTSFSYQGIIKSFKTYLGGHIGDLKKAIFWGITIPFVFYAIWQAFILGLVPKDLLLESQTLGKSALYPLEKLLQNSSIFLWGTFFAFFAITTSFLGVTLGLKDFLKDGLQLSEQTHKIALFFAT